MGWSCDPSHRGCTDEEAHVGTAFCCEPPWYNRLILLPFSILPWLLECFIAYACGDHHSSAATWEMYEPPVDAPPHARPPMRYGQPDAAHNDQQRPQLPGDEGVRVVRNRFAQQQGNRGYQQRGAPRLLPLRPRQPRQPHNETGQQQEQQGNNCGNDSNAEQPRHVEPIKPVLREAINPEMPFNNAHRAPDLFQAPGHDDATAAEHTGRQIHDLPQDNVPAAQWPPRYITLADGEVVEVESDDEEPQGFPQEGLPQQVFPQPDPAQQHLQQQQNVPQQHPAYEAPPRQPRTQTFILPDGQEVEAEVDDDDDQPEADQQHYGQQYAPQQYAEQMPPPAAHPQPGMYVLPTGEVVEGVDDDDPVEDEQMAQPVNDYGYHGDGEYDDHGPPPPYEE